MNANSSLTATIRIDDWLAGAIRQLQTASNSSARLDCLILLEHVIGKDRAWLLAHLDLELSSESETIRVLNSLLTRRMQHEPIAYLIGQKEFYGRVFIITPEVLIPRPETETGIEFLKKYARAGDHLLDVGTGSGCIAITASIELPEVRVEACDISTSALLVAQQNSAIHQGRVGFLHSNLLTNVTGSYDLIIANLPYVDRSWQQSPELAFEPSVALFQKDDGLALINRLVLQAPPHLHDSGYLLLEADPRQHHFIINYARTQQFSHVTTDGLWLVFKKRPAASH